MTIKPTNFIIAIAVSGLISYGISQMASVFSEIVGIGTFIYSSGTLGIALGVKHDNPRAQINLSALSGMFFLGGLVFSVAFSYLKFNPVPYVIIMAVGFLFYLLLVNYLGKTTQ